ncbi:uncharacterized protein LOC108034103 [Drosophila biarmipes]|uniref:uncharacterized protein LOC108034103 n=1 Tax=Drosophila biarmipes TaxID=125945 RepID=UPI0007E5FA8A|nr:uncharacterized protein LOC108034103 [Drosophila biarmipes]
MKIYEEVIYTDQLLHHRTVGSQIEETRRTWEQRCSWFPTAQREFYGHYAQIYKECLRTYGNDHFEYYAKRNRLREEFRRETKSYRESKTRDSEISMDHVALYKATATSNAEYGSVRPMLLFKAF